MGGRHYYLAKELTKLGYKVHVIAASYTHLLRKPPQINEPVTIEQCDGFNMVWVKMPHYEQAHSKRRILNWFSFAWKLQRLDRNIAGKPDAMLYSSPSLVGFLGAERLARKLGASLAFEVRDIWPLTLCEVGGFSQSHPFIRFLQWVENRAYRKADVVISNLKNASRHMMEHGLGAEKFHWIPNGISLEEVVHPAPLSEAVRGQLDPSAFKVGYVGTLGVVNCLDTLIDAASQLKDNQSIQFVLVGRGREVERLKQRAKLLGLDNVVFAGAIPKTEVQSALKIFDVLWIGANQTELHQFGVSPNKLFDYMYAAKPILYAIDSGDYHPIADAGAGYEIVPEDTKALADAILRLFQASTEEREEMGRNARNAVLTEYDYAKLAKKLASSLGVD